MIISGVVRGSVGDEISRHNGRRVLVRASELDEWIAASMRLQAPKARAANVKSVVDWLTGQMSASLKSRPHPRDWYFEKAREKRFRLLSKREFLRCWARAIEDRRRFGLEATRSYR